MSFPVLPILTLCRSLQKSVVGNVCCLRWISISNRSKVSEKIVGSKFSTQNQITTPGICTSNSSISSIASTALEVPIKGGYSSSLLPTLTVRTLFSWPSVRFDRAYVRPAKSADTESQMSDADANSGWAIRLANENGYLSWCRNTYLATVVGVGMWAEGPSSIAFHATEGALFLGGLNLVLGTLSYLHTIYRVRRRIHMSLIGAGLHTLAALTHLGIWLTVVVTYLGYVESEEEVRHPGNTTLDILDQQVFALRDTCDQDDGSV